MQEAEEVREVPFTKYRCWRPERVSQVINKEAVAVDKAAFLATHTPFSYIKYMHAPQELPSTDEESLLQELIDRGRDDQHTFVVLQGVPGSGKSHLIRWLKERYEAQSKIAGISDVILLIERAQCNLRSTLEQIIRAGLFDDPAMSNHLKRLEGAASTLSSGGLADTILNNFQVAAKEVDLAEADQPSARIKRNIEEFLLDRNIRRFLQAPGGPITRIMRFLSTTAQPNLTTDELPRFEAADFNIPMATLNNMRQEAYQGARDLADDLRIKERLRVELARFLNNLLGYAIGHTIALTSDDLKEMFNELRRHLRGRNRQLALFIEDIAALSGLDAGLIDALVTQHTGEANQQLCRLTSVVGVTDSYFDLRIPDNIRDRITHHLTLNVEGGDGRQSQLLTSRDALADLAARYLNAIRLSGAELETWLSNGAHPSDLPNACAPCQFRARCHAAFGGVDIPSRDGNDASVGLYPFNLQALATMYSNLGTPLKTPRALLWSIIAYVLNNAGSLYDIEEGLFPPPPERMGSEFEAPELAVQPQRNTIQNQAGGNAKRIESLILFWGDRTAYSTSQAGQGLLSGLPAQVFEAFSLPFIEGERLDQPNDVGATSATSTAVATNSADGGRPSGQTTPTPMPLDTVTTAQPPVQQRTEAQKYNNAITQWQNGGKLQYYEEFTDWLVSAVQNYIDWEAYDIHPALIRERVTRSRFIIEDQAGKIAGQDHILFPRSMLLANLLYALADLTQHGKQFPESPVLAAHLLAIGSWLQAEEGRIAEFVGKPSATSEPPGRLLDLLIADCLSMEVLSGNLDPERQADSQILSTLIDSAVKLPSWSQQVASSEHHRTQSWLTLMRAINQNSQHNRVDSCRKALVIALNRAQGDVTAPLSRTTDDVKVRFIDAAAALDALNRIRDKGWKLPPISHVQSGVPVWADALEAYDVVQTRLPLAVNTEHDNLSNLKGKLDRMLGTDKPAEVFSAVSAVLMDLNQIKRVHSFRQRPDLSGDELSTLLTELDQLVTEKEYLARVVRLSGSAVLIKKLITYSTYLANFEDMLNDQHDYLEKEIAQQQAISTVETTRSRIAELYGSLSDLLKDLADIPASLVER